jgi:hypothetical protein
MRVFLYVETSVHTCRIIIVLIQVLGSMVAHQRGYVSDQMQMLERLINEQEEQSAQQLLVVACC